MSRVLYRSLSPRNFWRQRELPRQPDASGIHKQKHTKAAATQTMLYMTNYQLILPFFLVAAGISQKMNGPTARQQFLLPTADVPLPENFSNGPFFRRHHYPTINKRHVRPF
ncbi:MAG: hypothetical protein ACLR2G_12655 [Phascolarctobacterium faecium]